MIFSEKRGLVETLLISEPKNKTVLKGHWATFQNKSMNNHASKDAMDVLPSIIRNVIKTSLGIQHYHPVFFK